jgi:processive 1,2-diacylglycerol beta-glucosyltransferase
MRRTHVAVLSVSAGAGHVRAAQALCAAADLGFPHLRLTHIDVMDVVPPAFRKLYAELYIKLVEKMPLAWAYLYQRTDRRAVRSPFDRLRRSVERLNTRKLDRELRRLAPQAIVCTHFLPAELLSQRIRRGRPTPPVWVQVTDFDAHGLWLQPHMAGYFVANDEVAWRIAARGIARERVFVTGIPIMPQFSTAPPRAECAAELGLDADRTTLLLMSGGAGVGGIERLAERLVTLGLRAQIIALAGRNQALLAALRRIARRYPGRLVPLGFTDAVERVMAAADVAITKPGGLTSSECLAMGLPIIVISPIPGQEERNADFLLESGVAVKAIDAAALEYKLRLLLERPEQLAAMRARMRAQAKPDAAARVLHLLSDHLQPCTDPPRSRSS